MEEWAIVKRHPLVGAAFFSGSDSEIIQLAEIVAMTHTRSGTMGLPARTQGRRTSTGGPHCHNLHVFDAR